MHNSHKQEIHKNLSDLNKLSDQMLSEMKKKNNIIDHYDSKYNNYVNQINKLNKL